MFLFECSSECAPRTVERGLTFVKRVFGARLLERVACALAEQLRLPFAEPPLKPHPTALKLVDGALAVRLRVVPLTATDRVLQLASLGFDASVLEIFTTLSCGACLVLTRREHISAVIPRDGGLLLTTLRAAERLPQFERPALIAWSADDELFPPRQAAVLDPSLGCAERFSGPAKIGD